MSEEKPDLGTIGLCAVLGAAVAGAILGILMTATYVQYTDNATQAVLMLVTGVAGGAVVAVCIGGPIGLALGLIVSRWIGTSITHAALTGALTGAAYPMFFLVVGLLLRADGLPLLAGSFAMFMGLGAVCGALAHRTVIGRATARRS